MNSKFNKVGCNWTHPKCATHGVRVFLPDFKHTVQWIKCAAHSVFLDCTVDKMYDKSLK